MTLDEVRAAVADLERIAGPSAIRVDHELAHGMEDALHEGVLAAIAMGILVGDEARAAAELALATQRFDFERWCA